MVLEIKGVDHFDTVLKENSKVCADITATWCGPCQRIKPAFTELAEKHGSDICFVKVDLDENDELASKYQVEGVPTFLFFKDGKLVEKFSGANEKSLRANVASLLA